MSSLAKHLRSHILRTSTVSRGKLVCSKSFFAESEISYFKISIHVNHDIFRFDVSIDDVLVMKILNTCKNFNKTVSSLIFCHFFDLSEVKEQLTSWTIL